MKIAKFVYKIFWGQLNEFEKFGMIACAGALLGVIFLYNNPEAFFETMAPLAVLVLFVVGFLLLEFGKFFFPETTKGDSIETEHSEED